MIRNLLPALLLLAVASSVLAGTDVNLSSNVPAQVLVDGRAVGNTPMHINDLAPGAHRVDVVRGDDVKTYAVYSSRVIAMHKNFSASFEDKPQVAGFQTATAPMAASASTGNDEHRRKKHRRGIFRWILLGGEALNELTGTGKSRIGWRTGLLSAIGLNEAILW